jgi:hypothetical protein
MSVCTCSVDSGGTATPDHCGAAAWPLTSEKQRLPRLVFRSSIARLSDSLSTLRSAGCPRPTQDSLPAAGQALPDGLSPARFLRKDSELLPYISSPFPKLLGATRHTKDGRLAPDNNLSERTLRLIAVGRSNWKFVGSAPAGERAAVHFSLVGTCRHLGLDAVAYLREVLPALHALGEKPTDDQLAPLLPDVWAKRHHSRLIAA